MNRTFAWPVGQDKEMSVRPSLHPTVLFALASVVGGAVLGGILAGLASGLARWGSAASFWLIVAVGIAATVGQKMGKMGPLPERKRQVDRRVLASGERPAALRYGFVLGAMIFTYIHFPAAHIALLGIVATGSESGAFAAGVTFGIVRGLIPLTHRLAIRTPELALNVETGIARLSRSRVTRQFLALAAAGVTVEAAIYMVSAGIA